MKFDKETIIVFLICIVVLLGWNPLCQKMGWIKNEPKVQTQQNQQVQEKTVSKSDLVKTNAPETAVKISETAIADKTSNALPNLPPQNISNAFFTMSIEPLAGAVSAVKLNRFPLYSHTDKVSLFIGSIPAAASVDSSSGKWKTLELLDNNRSINDGFSVTRKIIDTKGQTFMISQQWEITDSYSTKYQITLRNPGSAAISLDQVTVNTGSIPPLHQLAGDTVITESHCVDMMQVNGDVIAVNADAKEKDFKATVYDNLKWIGITNKYFCCILLPEKPFDGGAALHRQKIDLPDEPDTLIYSAGAGGIYKNITIEPGNEVILKFNYYAGPKVISEFKKIDPSIAKVMHLSWGPLDWLARLMLVFLVFLKSFCGSYGWSIIVLTIIVRLLFWPVTQKANNSMKKMQKLQPQMTEIRAKYKETPQQMNAKIMELYKQEGVNPLGGCFPILLQIPVFFALYATLDGAIELRQVSFLWAKDLTLPDTIAVIFNLLPLNPLVLVMTALMVLQQKMTPAPADPMQQKMLMFMPIVMLFVLYNLPSGLTLYWTVSQIFSILQLYATQKFSKDAPAADKNAKPKLKNA